jgi:hypothetical protein
MRFPNLFVALRNAGLKNYEAAAKIGIHETDFSRALSGRLEFSGAQKVTLEKITGVPQSTLFSTAPPGAAMAGPTSSWQELFKYCDDALAGGDVGFVLEKLYRGQSYPNYAACVAHVLSVLRMRWKIRLETHFHVVTHFEGPNCIMEPGPPRGDRDSLQSQGSSLIHPLPGGGFPAAHENALAPQQGQERR